MREMASFALAAIGFLLRTTGVALLAAWVMEASCGANGGLQSCAGRWRWCPSGMAGTRGASARE